MAGRHQADNAGLAVITIGELRRRGFPIPEMAVRAGLALSLVYLAGVGGAYLLVIGPSQELVTLGVLQLRGRWLDELVAIAVCLHGWFFRAGADLARLRTWQWVQPCFLEGALLGVGLMLDGEISTPWKPVAWSLLALVLVCPALVRLFASRLQVYAVLVYWLSVLALVHTLGGGLSPFPPVPS
jgi:hypothetical protein